MNERIPVGVLGATGMVGETLLRMLSDHPWFEVAEVAASERRVGEPLGSMVDGTLPDRLARLTLRALDGPWRSPLLLSALPASVARELEPELAARGHLVVSNASAHRADPGVPLLVPEVNPDHLVLLDGEGASRAGGIVTNPNCSVAGLVMALAPLHRTFGIERLAVTTFQAMSGAGRPGPAAFDLTDNVIPYISGEEEKIAREPRKILGTLAGGRIEPADFEVDVTATRVPVLHGHLAAVSVGLRVRPPLDEVEHALRGFDGAPEARDLPTSPDRPLEVLDAPDRPQPRLDRERGGGMTVSLGRLRAGAVFDASFLVLSHNLVRGAAGAALLDAELCVALGRVPFPAGGRPRDAARRIGRSSMEAVR